jgi:hypothetical protein
LFSLGRFLKITKVAKELVYFYRSKNYALSLTNNGFGYILDYFFTHSSVGSFFNKGLVVTSCLGTNFAPTRRLGTNKANPNAGKAQTFL